MSYNNHASGYSNKSDSRNKFHGSQNWNHQNNGKTTHKPTAQIGNIHAPYNFVPMPKNIQKYNGTGRDKDIPDQNAVAEELHSGKIEYEITANTPIYIGNGVKDEKVQGSSADFYKNQDGKYAIPGSTMRGLIRSNVQVLGLCDISDDIEDYKLMYRNVATGANKGYYNDNLLGNKQITLDKGNIKLSILSNVRAGYIINKGGQYFIYKTAVDSINQQFGKMNYYVVSERYIAKNASEFQYLIKYKGNFSKLQHVMESGFRKEEKEQGGKKRIHYIGKKNKWFMPFFMKVSYKLNGERQIRFIGDPKNADQNGVKLGYVLISGAMNEKKAVYIIPEIIDDEKTAIQISNEDIKNFQVDYNKRKNTLTFDNGHPYKGKEQEQELKKFFALPEEGETKPVFYIQLGNSLYFGFTPRLRVFYDHSIKDGIKSKNIETIDYNKALFGYTDNDDKSSRKTRISFSDAVIEQDATTKKENRILGEPGPTDYYDYLKQTKGSEIATYNDDFEIRGIKQYWFHKGLVLGTTGNGNEKVGSVLYPLPAKTKFRGVIRFHNLKDDELGLLLWSVKLNAGSEMNIGMGKPYGFGRVSVTITNFSLFDMSTAYKTTELNLNPYTPLNEDDQNGYINKYKEQAKRKALNNRGEIDNLDPIKAFFAMKDSNRIPAESKTTYMNLDEYTKYRKNSVLPDALHI